MGIVKLLMYMKNILISHTTNPSKIWYSNEEIQQFVFSNARNVPRKN